MGLPQHRSNPHAGADIIVQVPELEDISIKRPGKNIQRQKYSFVVFNVFLLYTEIIMFS